MIMFRKNKKQNDLPGELIDNWQSVIFSNLGIDGATDHEQIKEACRKILLATGRLYENVVRIDDGLKPLHFKDLK